MNSRLVAILPAALVPATVAGAERLHLPDALSGLIVGALIGLALVAALAQRRCPPAAT